MAELKGDKIDRVLGIYTELMSGGMVNKAATAKKYGVNERSVQRDLDDIRNYLQNELAKTGFNNAIIYDRLTRGYHLEYIYKMKLTNSEVLAVCKILLDSRAFTKNEMLDILERLVSCCVPKSEQKLIESLIKNEEFHYVELRHRTVFIDKMWRLGQAIRECRYVDMEYAKSGGGETVRRRVKPAAIMFSEYYFYLAAFIEDDDLKKSFETWDESSPTIYRIDRIRKLNILEERYHVCYGNRFEEGEFRKRVQFMYSGPLRRVNFTYSGKDVDAILDRLPTAKILDEEDGVFTLTAEVFGNGIDMWLRSQGDNVRVL